ncbi:pentapeptide repeat-containing protein [Flagellimonas sp. DF-77]|uniref:pentapeptide repeat-containing protein n=1 Tax=Flagellimonas algarum TaxID=3230298 RepID=UPI003399DF49
MQQQKISIWPMLCLCIIGGSGIAQQTPEVKSFEATVKILQAKRWVEADRQPQKPKAMPQYDDENPTGFEFFRTFVEDEDLSYLDLERTFFNRSEISGSRFVAARMRESNLCWNDFYHTDFSKADLSGSDMRAAIFEHVKFIDTDLSKADLRQSSFEACDFSGALMKGTKLTRDQQKGMVLSAEQIAAIQWMDKAGEEPDGG